MTWELGRYEDIALQLLPAAAMAVGRLDPLPGEYVIDVGCGTGNAAFLAAERGATVLGIDPTHRLLEVARQSGKEIGSDVRFEPGDGASIPVEDGVADAVISVFAVIFAPDAFAAATEMIRVLKPGGRIVLTSWLPHGALGGLYELRQGMLDEVAGPRAPDPPRFNWHDPAALVQLFGHHGFNVEVEEAALSLTGVSVDSYVATELESGPLWVEARSVLEPAGSWPRLRGAAHQTYFDANEDPSGFRLTTRYAVVVASGS